MDDGGYHAWQQEQKLKQAETALTFIAEEYEKLKAENERILTDYEMLSACHAGVCKEIELLHKDAERYRWLERKMIDYVCDDRDQWARMKWLVGPASLSPSTLAEAIDAAMM